MTELLVSGIEDAVIRLATAQEAVSRIVVETSSTTFLAYNAYRGYSRMDFRHPEGPTQLRELCAALDFHCDLDRSDQFYTALYRDMIRVIDPQVGVLFTQDRVLSAGDSSKPRSIHPEPRPSSDETVLVAFGDSNTYGEELDISALGHEDAVYRVEHAFPSLVARELGISRSINLGESGCGNGKIMRTLCDFALAHRQDAERYFLIVSLTHPARKAFVLRNGVEFPFVYGNAGWGPRTILELCTEVFCAAETDPRLNEEVEHKAVVVSRFLRKLRFSFVIFPCWNFAMSHRFFEHKDLGREAVFFFGPHERLFGMQNLVSHLPSGKKGHTLNAGHALFAHDLSAIIRKRALW